MSERADAAHAAPGKVTVLLPRAKDHARYRQAAKNWARRNGVATRGKGPLSAWVRHLMERAAREEGL